MNMHMALLTMLTLSLSLGGRDVQVQPPTPDSSGFVLAIYDRRPHSLDDEPELAAVIADLREAVSRRDASLVEPWLAAQVYWGEEEGAPKSRVVAEMRAWSSEQWDDLGRVLQLGVAMRDQDSAIAPFTVEALSEANASLSEEFDDVAAAADAPTAIHLAPDSAAPILATVERAIVAVDSNWSEGESRKGWARIKLPNGRPAYVSSTHLSGMQDEFAVWFSRGPEGWRVVAFGIDC